MSDYDYNSPEEQERRRQALELMARMDKDKVPPLQNEMRLQGDPDPRLIAEDDAREARYFARQAAEQRTAEANRRTATADAPDYLPDSRADRNSALAPAVDYRNAPPGATISDLVDRGVGGRAGSAAPAVSYDKLPAGSTAETAFDAIRNRRPDTTGAMMLLANRGQPAGEYRAHERAMMVPWASPRAAPDVTTSDPIDLRTPKERVDEIARADREAYDRTHPATDSREETAKRADAAYEGALRAKSVPLGSPEPEVPRPGKAASTDSSLLGATPEERGRRAAVVQSEMSAPPAFKAGEVAAEQPEARAALPEHAPSDIAADFYNSVAQNKDVPEEQQKQAAALAEQATKSGVPQRPRGYATATGSPMWNAYASQSFAHTGGDVHSDLMTLASRGGGGGGGGGGGAGGGMDGDTAAGLGMMAFDVLANRGRGLGTLSEYMGKQFITPYEQQKRELDLEHTRAEIDHLRQAAHQMDPLTFQMQMQRLEIQRQQLEQQKATQARIGANQNRTADRLEHGQATQKEQWDWENSPYSEGAQNARDLWVGAGGDPKLVEGKNRKDIRALDPAMNALLESTGQIGQARTAQAAATAGAEETAKLPIKNAEATHAAEVQGEARTKSLREARLAPMVATRGMGEAELDTGFESLKAIVDDRWGGAAGTKALQVFGNVTNSRGGVLPREASYVVIKQAMVNALEKMLTGNGPHDSAVTRLIHSIPEYDAYNAAAQLEYVHTELKKLGAAGGAALERVRQGEPANGSPSATPGQRTVPVGPAPQPGGKKIAPEDFHDLGGVLQ